MWRRLWQLLIFNSHDYLPLEEEGGKTQDTHREVLLSPLKGFAYLTAVISLLIIGGVVGFYIGTRNDQDVLCIEALTSPLHDFC